MSRIRETEWTSKEPLEKRAGEQITRSSNFSRWLNTGITVTGAVVTITDEDGESTTAAMIHGTPSVSSPNVIYTIKAGEAGKSYTVTFTLTLSNSDINIARKKLVVS